MSQSNDAVDQIQSFADKDPPLRFGSKRLYYQYSVAIPQIQLVLASVLQGIVFTILLTKLIPPPQSVNKVFILFQLPEIFQTLQLQYFYLPYILTSLVILIAWMDFVYASAVFIWPPTALQAGLVYLLTVVEIAMVNTVSPENIAVWRSTLGLTTIIGGLIRCNNVRIFAPSDFEDPQLGSSFLSTEGKYGAAYIILGSIGTTIGLLYYVLLAWVQPHFPQPHADMQADRFLHWFFYLIILGELCGVLFVDMKNRQKLLQQLTEKTDLEVTRYGGIRHGSSPHLSKQVDGATPRAPEIPPEAVTDNKTNPNRTQQTEKTSIHHEKVDKKT